MNNNLLYKNYFIDCESFQREKHGSWVPQYTITRQVTESNDFPSHQYQFSHTLPTKNEADRYAAQKAQLVDILGTRYISGKVRRYSIFPPERYG